MCNRKKRRRRKKNNCYNWAYYALTQPSFYDEKQNVSHCHKHHKKEDRFHEPRNWRIDDIENRIEKAIQRALDKLSINIEVNPEINLINDTQREVAIGKKGVGAGENTNIGLVGRNGSAGAGNNPEVASVGKDGTAQIADPLSAQASNRGNAASNPQDRFNQGTESGKGDLDQEANQN
jgi:hypothetical protein